MMIYRVFKIYRYYHDALFITGVSSLGVAYYLALNTGAHQLFCSQRKVNQSTRGCKYKRDLTTHAMAWSVSKVLDFMIPELSR